MILESEMENLGEGKNREAQLTNEVLQHETKGEKHNPAWMVAQVQAAALLPKADGQDEEGHLCDGEIYRAEMSECV